MAQPLPPQTTDSRSLQILLQQQQQLVQQQMQQMQGMFLFQPGGQSNSKASAAFLQAQVKKILILKPDQ